MSVRYFRSSPAVYEAVCAQLDAAYGYPNEATKTERSLPLADTLPRDDAGRVYLELPAECCDYILPLQLLPELIASGAVEEITQAEFAAAIPPGATS